MSKPRDPNATQSWIWVIVIVTFVLLSSVRDGMFLVYGIVIAIITLILGFLNRDEDIGLLFNGIVAGGLLAILWLSMWIKGIV